jgi:hypothetical protein
MAERTLAEPMVERRRIRRSGRFIFRMVLFLVLVAGLAAALFRPLSIAFMGNPAVNGVILGLLLAGIVYIFRQVLLLGPESEWIENFRERLANRDLTAPSGPAPRLLASMAGMLGSRQSGRVSLSATSLRTLLDGIASRLDETRETSRYLIGTLIFLGLLGTFYGLLETVRSVGGVIGGLDISANDVARAFAALKSALATPLHGMATAFSASLFGLSGSLVLGFLDLQAGQAQNRFYNDLEEWLSTYTRLSSGAFGDGGEGSVPAYIQTLLEQTADSLDNLQRILARSEESRLSANATLGALSDRLASLMVRLGDNHLELKPALVRLATVAENSLGRDDVLSGHMRNIEAYMARMTEDIPDGRAQSVAELRGEIRLLARTIAALVDDNGR